MRSLAILSGIAVVAALSPVLPVRAADPTPIARWTFDETSGSTVADAIGDLDGQLVGDASRLIGSAAVGTGALRVSGAGYVAIPDDPALEGAGPYSIAMWVRSGPRGDDPRGILAEKGSLGCAGSSWGMYAGSANGALYTQAFLDDGGYHYPAAGGYITAWDPAVWHHVVAVFDPVTGVTRTFVDGFEFVETWPEPDAIRFDGPDVVDGSLRLGGGGDPCTGTVGFVGDIDDVRIYDVAITKAQALALLPSYPTTTTIAVLGTAGVPDTTLSTEDVLELEAAIAPMPAGSGDVTWYRTVNGGPEEAFAVTPTRATDPNAVNYRPPAGSFPPGSYTVRAAYGGFANWGPSASSTISFTVSRHPVPMTLEPSTRDVLTLEPFELHAFAAVDPQVTFPPGSVSFYDVTGGAETLLGSAPWVSAASGLARATVSMPGMAAGTRTYEARYAGGTHHVPATATSTVTSGKQRSVVTLSWEPQDVVPTGQATVGLRYQAFRRSDGPDLPRLPSGTVSVTLRATGQVVATQAVSTTDSSWSVTLPKLPVGTHEVIASYGGNADYAAATSAVLRVTIVADTVQATGVGRDVAKFYPVSDGYLDSVRIVGNRQEAISATIRIYSPGGTLLLTRTISRGVGTYATSWNGRTSTGTLRSEGRYKIVQTLVDAAGTSKAFTSYVDLDHARLVYRETYVTKLGSAVSAKGDPGSGSIAISTTGGYAKLTGGWVGVGYQFALPAAIRYSSIQLQVYGRSTGSATRMGMQNFSTCPYVPNAGWVDTCFDGWTNIGTSTGPTAWFKKSGSPTYNRYGRTVRGLVTNDFGTFYVYKVRVYVKYGVLSG